jgi:LysM repeat protein/ABC-type branched-subunit amino acid transport system substrate-binding protein
MIKFFRELLFFILILWLGAYQADAQFKPAPVEKSNQKILHSGKVYFIHKVKKDQTLYSISRAYGVTEQDIAVANPNIILEVIKPGQVLKIPENSQLESLSETYFGLTKNDFIYHTVQPQQTLYYVSRKYDVPKELIIKYNPGSDEVIQIGQVLKIPKKHIIEVSHFQEPAQDDTSTTYTVKPGDTLYSLAKKYGVSVADFILINPELRWGLKAGMNLRIPGYSPFDILLTSKDIDSTLFYVKRIPLYSNTQCDSIAKKDSEKQIKIVAMLPFYNQEILALDSIGNDSLRKVHSFSKYKGYNKSFLEFYNGLLISLDSLKQLGKNVTLFTYDTKGDTTQVQKILKELEIIEPDFIVGPVLSPNIQLVSTFSVDNEIPIILPVTKNSKHNNYRNPYMVYMLPGAQTEMSLYSDYISEFNNNNIILIHNSDSISLNNLKAFKNTLFSYFASKSIYESAIYKEFSINDSTDINLRHSLKSDMDNLVVILSDKEADVINILSHLNRQNKQIKIKVFGLPSWQKFNILRIEHLHKFNTVVYSPFFIDYSKKETKNFIKKCRAKLQFEPYRTISSGSGFNFAYLGYETGLIFSNAYIRYGDSFINCICTIKESLPESTYSFSLLEQGGFANNSINIIEFKESFDILRIPFTPTPFSVSTTTDSSSLPEKY